MQLRPELMPPKLDEQRVAELCRLVESIFEAVEDGIGEPEPLIAHLNSETGRTFDVGEVMCVPGSMDVETFVRSALSIPPHVPDLRTDELLELIERVYYCKGEEHEVDFWLELIEKNVPNPDDFHDGMYAPPNSGESEPGPSELLQIALRDPRR